MSLAEIKKTIGYGAQEALLTPPDESQCSGCDPLPEMNVETSGGDWFAKAQEGLTTPISSNFSAVICRTSELKDEELIPTLSSLAALRGAFEDDGLSDIGLEGLKCVVESVLGELSPSDWPEETSNDARTTILNTIARAEKVLRGRIMNMFSSSIPAEDLIVDRDGAAKSMESAISKTDTRFGVESSHIKGRGATVRTAVVNGKEINLVRELNQLVRIDNSEEFLERLPQVSNAMAVTSLAAGIERFDGHVRALQEGAAKLQGNVLDNRAGVFGDKDPTPMQSSHPDYEDYEASNINARLYVMSKTLALAKEVLGKGDVEKSRELFLTVSQDNKPLDKIAGAIELQGTVDTAVNLKASVAIVVLSGAISEVAAAYSTPTLVNIFGTTRAGRFASTFVKEGLIRPTAFTAPNEILSIPLPGHEIPTVGGFIKETAFTAGMFKVIGSAMKVYRETIARTLYTIAARRLIARSAITAEGLGTKAARELIAKEAALGSLGKVVQAVGGFAFEVGAFQSWDYVKANIDNALFGGKMPADAAFAMMSVVEGAKFLLLLKFGNFIARPITIKANEKARAYAMKEFGARFEALQKRTVNIIKECRGGALSPPDLVGDHPPLHRWRAGRGSPLLGQLDSLMLERINLLRAMYEAHLVPPEAIAMEEVALAQFRASRAAMAKAEAAEEARVAREQAASDGLVELTMISPEAQEILGGRVALGRRPSGRRGKPVRGKSGNGLTLGEVIVEARELFAGHDGSRARVSLRQAKQIEDHIRAFAGTQGLARATVNALWLALGVNLPPEEQNGKLGARLKRLITSVDIPGVTKKQLEAELNRIVEPKPVEFDAKKDPEKTIFDLAASSDPVFKARFAHEVILQYRAREAHRLDVSDLSNLLEEITRSGCYDALEQLCSNKSLSAIQIQQVLDCVSTVDKSFGDLAVLLSLPNDTEGQRGQIIELLRNADSKSINIALSKLRPEWLGQYADEFLNLMLDDRLLDRSENTLILKQLGEWVGYKGLTPEQFDRILVRVTELQFSDDSDYYPVAKLLQGVAGARKLTNGQVKLLLSKLIEFQRYGSEPVVKGLDVLVEKQNITFAQFKRIVNSLLKNLKCFKSELQIVDNFFIKLAAANMPAGYFEYAYSVIMGLPRDGDLFQVRVLGGWAASPKVSSDRWGEIVDALLEIELKNPRPIPEALGKASTNPNITNAQLAKIESEIESAIVAAKEECKASYSYFWELEALTSFASSPKVGPEKFDEVVGRILKLKGTILEEHFAMALVRAAKNPNISLEQFDKIIKKVIELDLCFRSNILYQPVIAGEFPHGRGSRVVDLFFKTGGKGLSVAAWGVRELASSPMISDDQFAEISKLDNFFVRTLVHTRINDDNPRFAPYRDELWRCYQGVMARVEELKASSSDSAVRISPAKGDDTDLPGNLGVLAGRLNQYVAEPFRVP